MLFAFRRWPKPEEQEEQDEKSKKKNSNKKQEHKYEELNELDEYFQLVSAPATSKATGTLLNLHIKVSSVAISLNALALLMDEQNWMHPHELSGIFFLFLLEFVHL